MGSPLYGGGFGSSAVRRASGLVLELHFSGEALRNRAVGRQYAEAGTGVPAPVAASAAWVDLVAPWDLPPRRLHALRSAPQSEGAVPAACRSECLKLDFLLLSDCSIL